MNSSNMHHSGGSPAGRKTRTALADALRKQIVHGHYEPGARLPTRDALVEHFGASKHTVQSALDRLGQEGFVISRTKAGTFVTDRPPHLQRFALVFPFRTSRSRFYEALREAARRVSAQRSITFIEYIQETDGDMRRLRDDASSHRLAGAVFVHPFHQMWESPMMTEPGAPKVLIQSGTSLALPDLHIDMDSFFRRAFELARAAGRKRLAVIFGDVPWGQWTADRFVREAASYELRVEPYWLAPIQGSTPQPTVDFAVRALMAMEGDRKPDALVIADDNYVTAAAEGLISCNVQVPRDLLVIAHCNYPLPIDVPDLPMTHLGFDCTVLFDHAVAILTAQRARHPINPEWLKPLTAQIPRETRPPVLPSPIVGAPAESQSVAPSLARAPEES